MSRLHFAAILILLCLGILLLTGFGGDRVFWSQWGRNAQHEGMVNSFGQPLNHKLADIVYDPFVTQEKAENAPLYGGVGPLTAHYQSTLIDDNNSFYMVVKSGTYVDCTPRGSWIYGKDCGPNAWDQLVWNVARYDWKQGQTTQAWLYWTDWVPVPNATALNQQLYGWKQPTLRFQSAPMGRSTARIMGICSCWGGEWDIDDSDSERHREGLTQVYETRRTLDIARVFAALS